MTRLVSDIFPSVAAGALFALCTAVNASSIDDDRHGSRWQQLRTALFSDRPVHEGGDVIAISAPVLADDPASVPVRISTVLDGFDGRHITSITVMVDHNPAPLAAVFHLGPRIGSGDINTRVRVNEFSYIRAVAETSDGELHVAKGFVKAHGGCDVPPLKDHAQIEKTLGKMKLSLPGGAVPGESSTASLKISHPNYNGMQVSNTAGVYLPARLVKNINVRYGEEFVLRMDGHLSLSHDPSIRFSYVPDAPAEMSVEVIDSENARFSQQWSVDLKN